MSKLYEIYKLIFFKSVPMMSLTSCLITNHIECFVNFYEIFEISNFEISIWGEIDQPLKWFSLKFLSTVLSKFGSPESESVSQILMWSAFTVEIKQKILENAWLRLNVGNLFKNHSEFHRKPFISQCWKHLTVNVQLILIHLHLV